MIYSLSFTLTAKDALKRLKHSSSLKKRFKAVSKTLKYLESNPRHPGLQTHEFYSLQGPNKEKVFEVYAEQNTPSAYRIFFYYGKKRGEIIIFAITPHP